MNAHREIIDLKGHDLHLHLPDEFANHRLEILVVALDDEQSQPKPDKKQRTPGLFAGKALYMSEDFDAELSDGFWLGEADE